MITRTKWALVVSGCAVVIGTILQVPQFLYLAQPDSKGIPVHLNSDEYQYLARIEEVLTGRPEQAAQPYLGDPYASGMHFALIEQTEGVLLRWTGWRAATVFQIMDSVVPVLLFLVLLTFFRLAGFSRFRALTGALLFIGIELNTLNRPVHQRESFLLVLLTIVLLQLSLERRRIPYVLLGGALLGFLVGIYLWSFLFAWIYAGLLFCWEFMAWWRTRPRPSFRRSRVARAALFIGIGAVAASPFVYTIVRSMNLPLYAEVALRQGMYFSRLPESWIYSGLFLLMSACVLLARRRFPVLQGAKQYAILFPIAVFVAINQQAVHGHVIAFTSHFVFAIAVASVCVFLLSLDLAGRARQRAPFFLSALGASALMLAAIAWDNRPLLSQFSIVPGRFSEQHFSTLLPVLDSMPRTRILSDLGSSGFIAASTRHDIVSSIYLESAFLPHEEIAERWCLTMLPVPPADRHIGDHEWLIWPDANAAARRDPVLRQREIGLVESACARLDADPAAALGRYGVQYVLWDERRQKKWDVQRLQVTLKKVREDRGQWSLYRIMH